MPSGSLSIVRRAGAQAVRSIQERIALSKSVATGKFQRVKSVRPAVWRWVRSRHADSNSLPWLLFGEGCGYTGEVLFHG